MVMQHQQPVSALLQCLQQLNDDVWIKVLMPKLAAHDAIESVALTCSSLRQLVQGNFIGCINLADCRGAASAQALPQHFPNAHGVALRFDGGPQASADALLPTLSRLPKLETIKLDVLGPPAPQALAATLTRMQAQLPQLRALTLRVEQSWAAAAASEEQGPDPPAAATSFASVWAAVGRATQLTGLRLHFAQNEAPALDVRDLATLSTLGAHLQELVITAHSVAGLQGQQQQEEDQQQQEAQEDGMQLDDGQQQGEQELQAQQPPPQPQPQGTGSPGSPLGFLASMSALRHLDLPLPSAAGLGAALAACTNLRSLELVRLPGRPPLLDAAACQALGHLSALEVLVLGPGLRAEPAPPLYAALQQLASLRRVEYDGWDLEALPALASLSHLTCLHGTWRQPGREPFVTHAKCSRVVALEGAGPVPFRAFPALETFTQTGPLRAGAVAALAQHCPALVALLHGGPPGRPRWPSLDPDTNSEQAVPAIQCLARLQRLQTLTWRPQEDYELAALAASVGQQLQTLSVLPAPGNSVTFMGLAQLGTGMRALQQLTLGVSDLEWGPEDWRAPAPMMLACMLRGVRAVRVVCGGEAQAAALMRALSLGREMRLGMPGRVELQCPRDPEAEA